VSRDLLIRLTNLVDNAPPYCRACDALHEEATCPIVRRILDNGMFGTGDQINVVGSKFPLSMDDWIEVKENSRDVMNPSSAFSINNLENEDDILARLYGEKPSPEQILEIARDKGLTYQRRDKDQSGNQIPPRTFNPGLNSGLDVDLGSWFNNAKIWVPVSEIAKIPSQRDKLLKAIQGPQVKYFSTEDSEVDYHDAPIYLQSLDADNKDHQPFFITLLVNGYKLNNCMLDSGASACVMTKRVMEQLNLRVSRPYYNICAMDSKKIEVHGLIKDLQVHLSVYPDIMIVMDIVVVDVPDAWGMLLSRKWASDLGGSIQMNWSYAMIPSPRGDGFVRLNREPERKFHVEDPKRPHNEIIKEQSDIGNYAIMSNFIIPPDDKIKDLKDKVWYMYFDGASSRHGKGAGIVLKSPLGHIFKFAYRLEFEATNNVAEYEAILLGLELAKALKIKLLSIKGDSDLIIMQLKNKFTCKNQRLRNYRNAVWDTMEHFDALDLEAIPREQNSLADELAVAATTFQLSDELINDKIKMEVIFRPSVPDNSEHWQVFNDEKQVIRFLNSLDEFEDFRIVSEEDGSLIMSIS
jgi:ribonuclease HI